MKETNVKKENFANFNPQKIMLKLAELYADQQGIKRPKLTIISQKGPDKAAN